MAKTFTNIAKTFDGLSVMIVAKGRRLFLILYLEAKCAKMNCKSQLWQKSQLSTLIKVNSRSQRSTLSSQRMMSAG